MALLKLVFLEGQRANSFFQGVPPFNRKTKGFSGIQTQDRAWARHWRLSLYQYTTATYWLVWTPLALAREQALLAVVIQTPHWYPSLQWYHNECSILDEPNTLGTYKTASGHIHAKGSWRVRWPTCSCTAICALAMVASSEIKALNKASRKQGLCSSKRVLYQCRLARSVEEVLSWHHHKTQLCQIHLIPHQPVVPAGLPRWCLLTWQASVMWWVYNECMNFVNNIAHRILLHYQQKGWANGF